MFARLLLIAGGLAAVAAGTLYALGSGWLGRSLGPGTVTPRAVPPGVVEARTETQRAAVGGAQRPETKQILFGDFHVHTTYSIDAFLAALPLAVEGGAHPVGDACDFARYCAALDFWSINDHAFGLTAERWRDTVDSIRQCNAVADPASPDVTAFLGWEWTQIGSTLEDHWGHKNVVLKHLDDARIPARPIAAAGRGVGRASPFLMGLVPLTRRTRGSLDLVRNLREVGRAPICPEGVPVRELPDDCREFAATPRALFDKLDDWGHESLVIPHGTAWGFYTPPGSTWDKQMGAAQHDPERQTLIEVYSGHGSSEEYRDWRDVSFADDGTPRCPDPRPDYLPSCWRAGELIRQRCLEEGEPEATCEERSVEARRNFVDAGIAGHLTVPGARLPDWLDSGQCRDCYLPAFNYRPGGSAQYILARAGFADPERPARHRLGFLASSDNHSARPGTGYKEFARPAMTDARISRAADPPPDAERPARSVPFDPASGGSFFQVREAERQASFFTTGGLVAAHAAGRDRDAIWSALERREVYGTSGPRILLWFDLVDAAGGRAPMGSEATVSGEPRFEVRAAGSLEQLPGCPDHAGAALEPGRLAKLCVGECYHPSDRRRPLARIEVVRILRQVSPDEPIAGLIRDPWLTHACEPDRSGCTASFSDPELAELQRDAVYYARAIEVASDAVNAANLRCETDDSGACLRTNACLGGPEDDCLAPTEARAWSSPIFVRYAAR